MSGDATSRTDEVGGWSKRKLRLALLASLAVNLLCIGLIGGSLLAGPPRRPHTEFGLLGFARTLPEDRAAVLRSAVEVQRPQLRELRQAARSARLEATAALEAETYDKEKIGASLVKIDEAETKLRTLVSGLFIDAAQKLTLDERRQLSEWWKRRQPKLFWRHGQRDAGDANRK